MDPIPTLTGFIAFCRSTVGIPTDVMSNTAAGFPAALEYSKLWIPQYINQISPQIYTLAVYNWGASYLIQFQSDPEGQVYFANARKSFGVNNFVPGVINSAHNEATSQSMTIGRGLSNMTLTDLQRVKDPYGRAALAILQDLGSLWGLT